MNDYYAVLGIERNATKTEIKEAYRFLVAQLHPDKHRDQNTKIAEKKLKELNQAYEVLYDDAKRLEYDGSISNKHRKNADSDVYNQTWTATFGEGLKYEATSLTAEQFTRILRANEATYDYVWLQFSDNSKVYFGKVITGTMPKFNGYYYLSREMLPKRSDSDCIVCGNTQTGELSFQFSSIDISNILGSSVLFNGKIIALRRDWNEYVRMYKQLIKLVNGE
jgi:curved DNA-binding protein CbpA